MYGHAMNLLNRCANGCDRFAVCIARDGLKVCAVCAIYEEREPDDETV